ncbi:retrovirus-related pol polyprotein from transposon TNT 1-94, partial [Tanacetum coccineum]
MTEGNKNQYIADVRVMNYLLQAIPNDIYNLVDAYEFDKFAAKEGKSLDSVHERLITLVNIMDRNNVRPIPVAINTKFFNFLQPEWSKYVTMVCHNQTGSVVSYDELYDSLVQFEPRVLASRAKKAAKNHDPLALIAHSNASSSHSYVNSSYSPQPYYVTHPLSVVDYDDEYQGELQGDSQEDKLTTAMMMVELTYKPRMQIMVEMITRIQGETELNGLIQAMQKGHYARECQKPKVHDAKYFREQMLLAMKDEARSNLSNEENDFMLDTSYGEDLEELTTAVHALSKVHEQSEHDSTTHDEYREIQMLAYTIQRKAKNKKRLNNELKKQNDLLQRKLETFKDWVKTFESNTIPYSIYKETCDELERELKNDKETIDRLVKEKEKIQNDFLKIENEKIIIQDETQLEKKAFKEREDRYLDDILDLEEKLSSHDRIVYKMGQSIQMIHMLGKKPNKVYDPFLKAGLGYTNHVCLKKAIAAQPKMYDGDLIHSNKLVIYSIDLEETLEDAEESRNKMRHKMVQIYYEKLNAFYETFVPQQELSAEQTYFSIPSTSDNRSKSKDVLSESPGPKMPKEIQAIPEISKLLLKRIKILENDFQRSQAQSIAFELKLQHQKEKMACDVSWKAKLSTLHDENVLLKHQAQHHNEIKEMIENVNQKTYDYADVRAQNQDLLMTIFELKNLEVAFRSNTCYVRNLEGDDLLTSSRDSNLYTISIFEMAASSSHVNKVKARKLTESKLELLHMDLCGPMRVASINGNKYILVIVNDYSRYTWVYFLRTKDEAPYMIIDFVNQVQKKLTSRTNNGTEFKNEKLQAFYANLGIVHKTSIARTLQQNGIVERRNRTLVEVARTILIFSKAPEFLWTEAIATACVTQNRSIVHTRHNKTPYELIYGRKPNIQYFHVFGSLCYPTNDCDDLGKMKPKADIGIFIGYSESSRGFRIYNRRYKKIMETIHVKFDELTTAAMASECNNLEPGINCTNFNDSSKDSQSVPSKSDLDNLFGPMYEEYYAMSSQEVSDNSAAYTLNNEHTSSSLSIFVEQD